MRQPNEFRADIFDRHLQWVAPLGNLTSVDATYIDDGIDSLTLTVPSNHPRLALLAEPGARLRVKFRNKVITGPVREDHGTGPAAGDRTFTVQSDKRILFNMLGYQNPAGDITNQGVSEYYNTGRHPAETVFKDVVTRNIVPRYPRPVTVAPDQGRGAVTEAAFRMHPLTDRLFPAIDVAGLGYTVEMINGALVVDCYTRAQYPITLTEQSRVITAWEYTGTGPAATHVIIGGSGDGVWRVFAEVTDPSLEELYGDRVEVFVDARGSDDVYKTATDLVQSTQKDAEDAEKKMNEETDATKKAEYTTAYNTAIVARDAALAAMPAAKAAHRLVLQAQGQETLAAGRPKGTLHVTLAESGNFTIFGDRGLGLGQVVRARVGNAIEVTDVLRRVDLKWSRADGLKVSAVIGPTDDMDDILVKAVTSLARGVHDLKAGK